MQDRCGTKTTAGGIEVSNPYYALKNAIHHKGSITTPYEVRRELAAYLDWIAAGSRRPLGNGTLCCVDTKGRVKMMSREEYHQLVNVRKRPRKKRNKDGELVMEYTNIEDKEVQHVLTANHAARDLDAEFATDFAYIDELARKQCDNDYNAEW